MGYFAHKLANVGSPQVQSRPALREKVVTLVDRRDSCDCARLVIEDFVGHMRRNAKTRHPRNAAPAQIMEPPPGHSRQPIKFVFRSTELLEWLCSKHGEYVRSPLLHTFQHNQ